MGPRAILTAAVILVVLPAVTAGQDDPWDEPRPQPSFSDASTSFNLASQTGQEADAAWELPEGPILQKLGIDVTGWFEGGITLNANGRGDGFNGPVVLDDRADEFQMNQLWVYAERPVDTGGHGFDLGGRIDLLYGTDARFLQTPGLEADINSDSQFYWLSLPQFYLHVGINDLTVKIGRFGHPLGYETALPTVDYFYSHAFGLIACEPLIVTGLLAEWKLSDCWSIHSGFHRGNFMFEDLNNCLDLFAGIVWTSPDEKTTLWWKSSIGPQDPAGEHNRIVYFLVYKNETIDNFTWVTSHFLGCEKGSGPGGRAATWGGIIQYLIYKINSEWSAGFRFEWCRDDSGTRAVGLGHAMPGYGWPGGPGLVGGFTTLSVGLHYKPHPNLTIRPELRCDWYNGTRDVNGNLPFANGTRSSQLLFAMDMVVTF